MSDNCRLVEGDGIITNIFYFLWKKKTDTGSLQATVPTSGDGCVLLPWERDAANGGSGSAVKFTPEFSVPSTVMFEHNYPKAWYYPHPTGKLSWEFERKLGKDIDSMSILKNFCPRSAAALEQYRTEESSSGDGAGGAGGGTASLLGGSSAGTLPPHLQKFEERDFVAAYFSTVKTGSAAHPNSPSTPLAPAPPQGRPQTGGSGGGRTKPHSNNDASGEEPLTVVEYMNEPQLRDFLLRRTKREDGFLQRWVWPNGKHNNVIQAIWTPHMCLVSRRTNQHAVRDSRETMYDRAVTYEGPSYLSGDSYVAPHVHWQVERFCADLVAYMFAEHHIPLRRMVLHFKVDWNSTVWFLWASSIRVQDKSQINLTIPYTARKELDAMRRQQALAAAASQQLRQHHSARSLTAVSTAIDFGKSSTDFSPIDTTDRGQHDAGRERFLSQQAPEARKLIHMLEAEKHLSAIPFPKAPSMGAIGGVYTWGSLIKPLSKSSKPKKRRPASGVRGGSDSATTANTANTTPTTKSTTTALVTRNNSLTGFPPPHSSTSSPAPKKLRKGRRGSKHHNSPLKNMLSPRFDDVLKSLQVERTTAFDSAMRHKDEREQHAALRRVLDDHVATLFGPHRHARTGKQLWAFVRHLVTSGYVRVHVALTEASELLSLVDYSVYSHFLSSEDPLTFYVSPALAKGVPTKNGASCVSFPDMLRSIGLVVTVGTTSAVVAAALKPAAPKHPHSAGHRRKSTMARQLPDNMSSSVVDGSPHVLSPVGGYSPTRTGGDSTAAAMIVSIASDGLPPPSSGAFFNANSSDHAQRGPKVSVAQHDDAPVVSSSFGAAPLQTLLSPNVQSSEVSTRNPSFGEQGSPLNLVAMGGSTAELEFLSQAAPPPSALQEGSTLCSVTITNTKKPIADVTASIKHTLLRDWVTPLLATSTWYMTAWQWILYRRPPHDENEQDEDELGSEDEEGAHAPNGETVEGTCPFTGELQQQATVEPPPAAPPARVVSTERIQRKSTAGERFSLLAVVDALPK